MEIKEYKKINEINKKFYKIVGMKCDCCGKEIKEDELYLEVDYHKERYQDNLKCKQFCEKCIKDSMYKMFMNNYYTDFNKYIFKKTEKTDWIEDDED